MVDSTEYLPLVYFTQNLKSKMNKFRFKYILRQIGTHITALAVLFCVKNYNSRDMLFSQAKLLHHMNTYDNLVRA
jgi:hypothetical protein